VGHEAYKRESRCSAEYWFGNLKERDHLEGKGVDGRVMLKSILRSWHACMWTEFICPKLGVFLPVVLTYYQFVKLFYYTVVTQQCGAVACVIALSTTL